LLLSTLEPTTSSALAKPPSVEKTARFCNFPKKNTRSTDSATDHWCGADLVLAEVDFQVII
jgi:hypothetical protein